MTDIEASLMSKELAVFVRILFQYLEKVDTTVLQWAREASAIIWLSLYLLYHNQTFYNFIFFITTNFL